MTLIVPAVLGGLALTVMALVSVLAARKGKHPAAGHHGEVKQAAILVHAINDDRCTGCDACVAVCPTNVLDLVHNKSRVVRFQDCIQCEACMWACPTTALVMHLEGSTPPSLKVPELDDSFQTAVPGQYLIGEVAGKPLVKNAANLGRVVVEHMLRTGMQPGALASMGPSAVDVLIVGSGPGGLSAALTCIHRGLSYVVLEKEQLVASTISRYPKGKLVMAEPYDVRNLSLLPVFDSSKEQLIPIWEALMQRTNMNIRRGETVETVKRGPDGVFEVRTTVASYQAQRVVLATGTRGKPRTLGVPGESLPKIKFLLEDPDEFRGLPVIVVGGGDSAVEAAIALADAGAKVVLSYRGRSFNRAQPKNKQTIESYAAQHRVKVRYQSNIIEFTQDTVTLELANGQRKTYPNLAGFMLIGSDPPVKWLEKLGVHFVERPHEYALGKTDELVMRFLGDAVPCPENADAAASLVLTGHVPADMSVAAPAPTMVPTQTGVFDPISEISAAQPQQQGGSGPRKWLRSATALFTSNRKLEQPIPLSEFAKRSSSQQRHSGDGRRDALPAAERTRILRMLRDEGGRIADEESRADILAAPRSPFDGDDDSGPVFLSPGPTPAAAQAQGAGPGRAQNAAFSPDPAAPSTTPALVAGLKRATAQGPTSWRARPSQPLPAATGDEPTIASDSDGALAQLLRSSAHRQMSLADDEATRAITIDSRRLSPSEDATRHARTQGARQQGRPESPRRTGDMSSPGGGRSAASSLADEEEDATHAVDISELAQRGSGRPSLPDPRLAGRDPRAISHDPRFVEPAPQLDDEATHAVDLNSMHQQAPPRSLTDVDWDLD